MTDSKPTEVPYSVRSIWPAVILFVVAIAILVVAQDYNDTARRFPMMVSVSLAVFAAIDFYSRTNLPGVEFIKVFWGSGFDRREMDHNPALRDEVAMLGWVLFAFAVMAVFGILVAAAIFCLLFVRLRSGRTWRVALAVAVIVLAFELAIFEIILDYQLYRGLIFTEEGFSAW